MNSVSSSSSTASPPYKAAIAAMGTAPPSGLTTKLSWDSLPIDLLRTALSYLSLSELPNVATLNRHWKFVMENDDRYTNLLQYCLLPIDTTLTPYTQLQKEIHRNTPPVCLHYAERLWISPPKIDAFARASHACMKVTRLI